MARRIVYVLDDGTEKRFPLTTVEDERHERAQAEREMRSIGASVKDYYFENYTDIEALAERHGLPVEDYNFKPAMKRHPHTGN